MTTQLNLVFFSRIRPFAGDRKSLFPALKTPEWEGPHGVLGNGHSMPRIAAQPAPIKVPPPQETGIEHSNAIARGPMAAKFSTNWRFPPPGRIWRPEDPLGRYIDVNWNGLTGSGTTLAAPDRWPLPAQGPAVARSPRSMAAACSLAWLPAGDRWA